MRAEIAPAALPDSTSETVDCDTPARRATSTLVTLDSDRAMSWIQPRRWTTSSRRWSRVDGRDLRLLRPRDAEALLDEDAFEHEEYLPYWAELWPSSLALARAIGGRALRGARTLELGCGLGLPSIAAALAGGRVLATDWSTEAIADDGANAERNGAWLETLVCSLDRARRRCSSARRGTSCSPPTSSTSPATAKRCSPCCRALGREDLARRPRPQGRGAVPGGGARDWQVEERRAPELVNGAVYRLRQPVAT